MHVHALQATPESRKWRAQAEDPLDNLVTAASDGVRAWMLRRARLADGTLPDLPVASL